jgi:hypothetical protein
MSPSIAALERLQSILDSEGATSARAASDSVPLDGLKFFEYLRPDAQRSLMQQLVAKFQRTSITPRNFILMNTPKYAPHVASYINEIITEYSGGQPPSLDEVGPNCFEDFDYDKSSAESETAQQAVASMPPPPRLCASRSSFASLHHDGSDAVAVDAAIAVALLIINSSVEDGLKITRSLQVDNLHGLNAVISSVLAAQATLK